MPIFNFKTVNTSKTNNDNKHKISIINENVQGVIHINKNAEYFVKVGNNNYQIHKDCFSCKNKDKVYRQGEYDENRVIYIRPFGYYIECNKNYWLPFGIGCIVTGNIIYNKDNDTSLFYITNCEIDRYNEDSRKAMENYRQHIKEINDIIRKRRYEIR